MKKQKQNKMALTNARFSRKITFALSLANEAKTNYSCFKMSRRISCIKIYYHINFLKINNISKFIAKDKFNYKNISGFDLIIVVVPVRIGLACA